jgi:hypothetical protein
VEQRSGKLTAFRIETDNFEPREKSHLLQCGRLGFWARAADVLLSHSFWKASVTLRGAEAPEDLSVESQNGH